VKGSRVSLAMGSSRTPRSIPQPSAKQQQRALLDILKSRDREPKIRGPAQGGTRCASRAHTRTQKTPEASTDSAIQHQSSGGPWNAQENPWPERGFDRWVLCGTRGLGGIRGK
jgi:hypothetical protein